MILIWSVVVILVILGGWWWLKELEWKTTAENAKLREHLKQPTRSDGYSWTNQATADVFQGIWLHWDVCRGDVEWPADIAWLEDENDEHRYNLSAEHLRTAYGLEEYFPINQKSLYSELIDYDQLSERLQELFKEHFPDKEYRIE